MKEQEKIALLEEAWDLDEGSLKSDMLLEDIEEYDSMAKLSLIVLCDDEFNKVLSGDDIKKFVTVKDILDYLE